MKIVEKCVDKYKQDGLVQLMRSAPKYIKNSYVNNYLWKIYLSHNGITTSQLKNISSKKGKIYHQEESDGYIEYTDTCEIVLIGTDIGKNTLNKKAGHNPRERHVYEVPDCLFFGGLAIPFYHGGCILEPFGGTIDSFMRAKNTGFFDNRIGLMDAATETYLNRRTHNKAENKSEIVFPLVHWYKSYYHWIVDYLPKLKMLNKYEKKTGNEPRILVRKDPASYRQESLELLGYSPERIIEWENNDYIKSRAIFTDHRIKQSEHSLQDYGWLRNRLFDKVNIKNNEYNIKKIYISRQGERDDKNMHNNERYVNNFQPFKKLIKDYGFKIVRAEEYSLEEQIQLFHSAEVIMGPHGGGLANVIFGKDPSVIELFPDSFVIPLYSYFCDTLEFDYQPVVVESDDGNNLVVNIDKFDNFLSETVRLG